MNLFEKMKNFFRKKKGLQLKDVYSEEQQKMIMEVWKTGKPMIGSYDENGKWFTKTIES